jgi:hypothetical protein
MAQSNNNTSEQNNFDSSTENTSSTFADRLQSYRSTSNALLQAVRVAGSSDALQRAASGFEAKSTAETLAKLSGNFSEITDTIKKAASPQLAATMALQASGEISQQQKALFELQKRIIPSSGTLAAAARLAAAGERTHKMLEWMNNPSDVKSLIDSLHKMSSMEDIFPTPKTSAFQSAAEHIFSAQKLIGDGLVGLMNNVENLSSSTSATKEEAQ